MSGPYYAEERSMEDIMGRLPSKVKKGILLKIRPFRNKLGIPESKGRRHQHR